MEEDRVYDSASYAGKTETQQIAVGGAGREGKDIAFNWKSGETQ